MAFRRLLQIACLLAFVFTTAAFLSAQDADAKPAKSGKGSMTVTGCVQKGTEPNGYFLTDESGKTWELTNSAAEVSAHVGHKVTLTGTSAHGPKAVEAKKESSEKSEAGGKEYSDFKVTKVKMLSDSCK